MDNIQEILDSINRICATGIRSKIDKDLLLDYTRRFYEQILNVDTSPVISPANEEAPQENQLSEDNNLQTDEPSELNSENTPSFQELSSEIPVLLEDSTENHLVNQEDRTEIDQPNEVVPEIAETNEPTEHEEIFEEEEQLSDEAQIEESLLQQQRNISFEPPHPAEESPLFASEGIEEDPAEENVLPPKNIPVEKPIAQPKEDAPTLTDYAKIFNFSATSSKPMTADIRKKIGINDKYLFLNELFNSDKSAYEKALDHINTIGEYPDAVDWVKDNPAVNYKWHDDDDTVLDFYEVLRKHFNNK